MSKKVENIKDVFSQLKELKEETFTKLKEIVGFEVSESSGVSEPSEEPSEEVPEAEAPLQYIPIEALKPQKELPEAVAPQQYIPKENIMYEPEEWQKLIEKQFEQIPPQQEWIVEVTKERLKFSLGNIKFLTEKRKELVKGYVIETEASKNQSEALEQQTEAIYRLDCVNNLIFNEENKVDIDGLVEIVYNYLKNNKYLSEEKVELFLINPYKIFYENLEVGSNKRVNVIYSTLVNYFYDY